MWRADLCEEHWRHAVSRCLLNQKEEFYEIFVLLNSWDLCLSLRLRVLGQPQLALGDRRSSRWSFCLWSLHFCRLMEACDFSAAVPP